MVCHSCYELRHPQDFVRAKVDKQTIPWSRPEVTNTFIYTCTTNSAVAGYAEAGCAIAGNNTIPRTPDVVPASSFTI